MLVLRRGYECAHKQDQTPSHPQSNILDSSCEYAARQAQAGNRFTFQRRFKKKKRYKKEKKSTNPSRGSYN